MAIKTFDELKNSVKSIIGERDDDEALALLDDMEDTLADANTRMGEDWKAKYEENDKAWRKRYKDRFNGIKSEEDSESPDTDSDNAPPPVADKTCEELFI